MYWYQGCIHAGSCLMGDKSAYFEMKGEQNHWGEEGGGGGDTSATPPS